MHVFGQWEEATDALGEHANSTQKGPRWVLNLEPSRCEATVLTTHLNMIFIFKWGVDREESGTLTCKLNSKLIGMYKRNVLGFMHAHALIHPDIFVHRRAFWFERTPCFSRKT